MYHAETHDFEEGEALGTDPGLTGTTTGRSGPGGHQGGTAFAPTAIADRFLGNDLHFNVDREFGAASEAGINWKRDC